MRNDINFREKLKLYCSVNCATQNKDYLLLESSASKTLEKD